MLGQNWVEIRDDEIGNFAKIAFVRGLYEGSCSVSPEWVKQKYYLNLNYKQLVDALDQFYSDYRNLNIPVVWVLHIINVELTGETEKAKTMIADFRKTCASMKSMSSDQNIEFPVRGEQ